MFFCFFVDGSKRRHCEPRLISLFTQMNRKCLPLYCEVTHQRHVASWMWQIVAPSHFGFGLYSSLSQCYSLQHQYHPSHSVMLQIYVQQRCREGRRHRCLPAGFLHARQVSFERIHSELILLHVSFRLHIESVASAHTLLILKSLNTPLPLPPNIQRFRICVSRVYGCI